MCTARGLQAVLLPAGGADQASAAPHAAPSPAPTRHAGGGDCDYCPLLAIALPAIAAPPSVPPAPPPPAPCTSRTLPARSAPHPCGLGSRGPPTVS
jgi:hypothetical protein